jgi:RNA polymerase sigma factor (sigma-70 family)
VVGSCTVYDKLPRIVMGPRAEDSIPTRQSLLLRVKHWDDAVGWREFFETYWELIYNVARKAGLNDAEAQDVVQETMLGVLRRIGDFKIDPHRGSFKSWLLGQARWRIGDQFRLREKANLHQVSGPICVDENRFGNDSTGTEELHRIPDPAGNWLEGIWNEEWEEHFRCLALEKVKVQVSPKQFQMFDLHVQQGLSVLETARALGATTAAVYMAKSRVGRLVRKEIKRLKTGV